MTYKYQPIHWYQDKATGIWYEQPDYYQIYRCDVCGELSCSWDCPRELEASANAQAMYEYDVEVRQWRADMWQARGR